MATQHGIVGVALDAVGFPVLAEQKDLRGRCAGEVLAVCALVAGHGVTPISLIVFERVLLSSVTFSVGSDRFHVSQRSFRL